MLATSRGHTEVVRLLAEAKADPNITDWVKVHYTHYCIWISQDDVFHWLQDGNTALILAARIGDTAIVMILVEHGADIHIKNNVSE